MKPLAREVDARTAGLPLRRALFLGLTLFSLWLLQPQGPTETWSRDDCFPYPTTRTAHLITADAYSNRTLRSIRILEGVGFDVRLEHAFTVKTERSDKIYSNKQAKLRIYKKIVDAPKCEGGRHGWGYVFEDDIYLVGKTPEDFDDKAEFSVERDLVGSRHGTAVAAETNSNAAPLESGDHDGIYLGICRPKRPGSAPPERREAYCGFCAHAYGLSRRGAAALLEYESTRKNHTGAMDVLIKGWCIREGGFPVSHVERASRWNDEHRGTFAQDRGTYTSLITPWKID